MTDYMKMQLGDLVKLMQDNVPINRARRKFSHHYAKIEQANAQAKPASIHDIRAEEFQAAEEIIAAYFNIPVDQLELVALDFCAYCGVLIPPNQEEQRCQNCGDGIANDVDRARGFFQSTEAKKILNVNGIFELPTKI